MPHMIVQAYTQCDTRFLLGDNLVFEIHNAATDISTKW